MKKIFRKEVIIGICVLVALAILILGIDFLKGVNVFKPTNYYYASFENVEGLAVSSPVMLNGFKVGQVREMEYEFDNPGHVLVEMSLDSRLKVPQGSKAVLGTDILGTASIVLHLSKSATDHSVGDRLIGENSSSLLASAGDMLPAVQQIFPKIDTLLTNLNAVVADPALTASVKRLDAISANLQTTTQRLAAATAQLGPIAADVKQITGNTSNITSDLAELSGQMKNLPLDSLVADLQTTTANLRALSDELGKPNSTLGRLINDPSLYDNLNTTISSLDSLFVDIKKNPKRYISIKLL
ncbi:MAG: MlaD family protein [Bacteroides sp.]|nr:MlaD family protein [Bacteroides sp.]MCM1457757.1 MlaD family protein [Lachnoclostridium sp.]